MVFLAFFDARSPTYLTKGEKFSILIVQRRISYETLTFLLFAVGAVRRITFLLLHCHL